MLPNQLISLFENVNFRFCSEVDLQNGIEILLKKSNISYLREEPLSARDRPDFLIDGAIAVEIKIKGTFAQALRQIDRYAKHSCVTSVVVIGSPVWLMQMPPSINMKPVLVHRLTRSLL